MGRHPFDTEISVLQQPTIYQQSKERKSLKSGALRKDYQEDPQEVHESVKQTAKDVSTSSRSDPTNQEKVGSGEIP